MKLPSPFLASILITFTGLQACGHESSPSNVKAAESKSPSSGMNLEGKANEAMGAAKDAVAKGKEEWKKFADTQVPEIDKQIAHLKDKAAKASGSAKVELDKLMQQIGEQRKALEAKLGELKTAGSEQWQSSKGDINQALADLKQSIDQALEKSK